LVRRLAFNLQIADALPFSNSNPDPTTANKIMAHAVSRFPDLVDPTTGKLDVVRHAVGMRTTRAGGVRIDAERKGKPTVYCNQCSIAHVAFPRCERTTSVAAT
jgi:hypothetical protein